VINNEKLLKKWNLVQFRKETGNSKILQRLGYFWNLDPESSTNESQGVTTNNITVLLLSWICTVILFALV